MAANFQRALSENIDVAIINNHHPDNRPARSAEVKKVFANAVRFMRQSFNRTRPVNAVVALPEPMRANQVASIGTQLEAQFSHASNLPLRRLQIDPSQIESASSGTNGLWHGPVAKWLLDEFASLPPIDTNADSGIGVTDYQLQEQW